MRPGTPRQLLDAAAKAVRVVDRKLEIIDEDLLDEEIMELLAAASSSEDESVARSAHWLIWSAAQALGFGSADPAGLMAAVERKDAYALSIPRFLVSRSAFKGATTAFEACAELEIGIVIFAAESGDPVGEERIFPSILAAGIACGWRAPFLTDSSLGGALAEELQVIAFDLDGGGADMDADSLRESMEKAGLGGTVAVLRRHLIPWPSPRPIPPELLSAVEE